MKNNKIKNTIRILRIIPNFLTAIAPGKKQLWGSPKHILLNEIKEAKKDMKSEYLSYRGCLDHSSI